MNDEAKKARRAYKREWQRNNPDKVKQQQSRYWEKRAAAARAAAVESRGLDLSFNGTEEEQTEDED